MPKVCSRIVALIEVMGVAITSGAIAQEPGYPRLTPISPCPALLVAAETNHIAMSQMDALSGTNTLRAGDSATFLGTLILHSNRTQWVLFVEAVSGGTNKPAEKSKPWVINVFGERLSFEPKPVPAKLRMLGPFSAPGASKPLKAENHLAEFSLNESFLGVGLDQAAAVISRRIKMTNSAFTASSKNSPVPTKTAKGTNSPATLKLTSEEKRALASAIPALMSYFEIVQHTEGLEDLLMKLVKTPSLWSIVRHRGVNAGLFFGKEAYEASPADWNLPASTPVYYLPTDLQINGQLALTVTLVVTAPRPPLLICGGVIGLLAQNPDDKETYMTLRVISARHTVERENESQNEFSELMQNK